MVKRMVRGFQEVKQENQCFKEIDTLLPTRADKGSAAYDFYLKTAVLLMPGETRLIFSDVKAYMQPNEVLKLYIRSSIALKKGIVFTNSVGIIDSSYYNNPNNDGNIGFMLKNISDIPVTLNKRERIAQGIFETYLVADNDMIQNENRIGGFGSSGK